MKLRDLLAGVPLEGARLDLELEINSICVCERDCRPGALFVETPGCGLTCERALERGAVAALPAGEDPWERLALLAANWYCRPGGRMTVAVVTGSGDSELVSWLLRLMLDGMPHTKVGAITPDSAWIGDVELPEGERGCGVLHVQRLLRCMADEGCTHAVLWLGENELRRREYAGLRVTVSALTGPVEHREELAALLENSDTVVLNLDETAWEDYGSIIPEHTFTYSENKNHADLTARNLRLYPGHTEFEAVGVGRIQRIHLPVPGGFTLYHGLCVLSCGVCLGLKWERMARVLRCVRGPKGRLEVLDVPTAYTVVQDRAGNARELEKLLVSVREFTAGQLICVLDGHGGGRQASLTAGQLADRVILTADVPTGEDAGILDGPCTVEPDRHTAVAGALDRAGPGDVIVLAGQQDERDFVRAYVENRHARRKKGALTGG